MVENTEQREATPVTERKPFEPPQLVLRGKLTPHLQGSGPPGPPPWDGKTTSTTGKPVP